MQDCRWCKIKNHGKFLRLLADCGACRLKHETAVARAAGECGLSTLPAHSPRAMRSQKKQGHWREEGQEEETKDQEERQDGDYDERKPNFTEEDIRDDSGKAEGRHFFSAAFADLQPLGSPHLRHGERWGKCRRGRSRNRTR